MMHTPEIVFLVLEYVIMAAISVALLWRTTGRRRAIMRHAYRRWRARHRQPCSLCRDPGKLVHQYLQHHMPRYGDAAILPAEMRCPNCYRLFTPSWGDALRGLKQERRPRRWTHS